MASLGNDLTLLPQTTNDDSPGYEPLILAAAAIGFLLAGQQEGGWSPAIGALVGLAAAMVVLAINYFLVPRETELDNRSGLLRKFSAYFEEEKSKKGEEEQYSEWKSALLMPAFDQKVAETERNFAWSFESEAWIDQLLRNAQGNDRLSYYFILLDQSALTTKQRLFMLRCLAKDADI